MCVRERESKRNSEIFLKSCLIIDLHQDFKPYGAVHLLRRLFRNAGGEDLKKSQKNRERVV